MERIRHSFERQGFMRTLGATLESVASGTVTISCATDNRLTQQHGLLHGGVLATLADVACGYAALTMMSDDREVLTVEFKVHFLKPARAIASSPWVRSFSPAGRLPCATAPSSTGQAAFCLRK